MTAKKKGDDGAQHFTCEHCGHDWRIGTDALPVAPHCPSCGGAVQAVVGLTPEPADLPSDGFAAELQRHGVKLAEAQPPRALTATGSVCAECGEEEGHKQGCTFYVGDDSVTE